jgi:fucose permease
MAPAAAGVVVAGVLAFFVLGAPDGGTGVAWPFMRASLRQPLEALGLITVAVTVGAVAMSTVSGWLTRRVGAPALLLAAMLVCAASLAGVALSQVWATVVLCFLAFGGGGGIIDAVVQARLVTRSGLRSMSALHAGYGIGFAVGPLLMTWIITAGAGWRAGFFCVAALYLAAGAALAVSWNGWGGGTSASGGDASEPVRVTTALTAVSPGVRRSLLLFFLLTGMEVAAGLWSFTFLTQARGLGTGAAGVSVSAFFAAQAASRVALAALGHRIEAGAVLLSSCAAVVAGAASMLALPGASTVAGMVLAGVGIGVIYPSLMVASSGRLGERRAQSVVGYQVAAANLGAAAGSGVTGVVLAHLGAGAFPAVLLVLAGVAVVILARRPAPRSVH